MTNEEKFLLVKSGLYCALTGTEPIDIIDDLGNEFLDIIDQTINFVNNIKCSQLAKKFLVEQFTKSLLQLKESIKIDLKECK